MAEKNLFQELKDVLKDFKEFLDENVLKIKPAVQALAALVPQINELIDELIDLMGKLKTEIQELDVNIPEVTDALAFTEKVKALLTASKDLLPDQSEEIEKALGVANVVTSLPSLDAIKGEILSLIDAITAHLNSLKAA